MALLELRDLTFSYRGATNAVDGVTLTVAAGEVVALVGPNGSGKSTLLRLASGLLIPDRGEVRVDGRLLAELSRREAARIVAGVASEQAAEHAFTVRASAALGRHPWRGPFAALSGAETLAVDRALEATDLTELADRAVASLSAGERQRAALARCLVQEARLMLMDEPTAHLDIGHRLRILDVLRERAARDGVGVLAALHDLNLAALGADRLVLLHHGRVLVEGPPVEVLTEQTLSAAFRARVAVVTHPERDVPVVVPLGSQIGEPA